MSFNNISVPPLPIMLLVLPLFGALLILGLECVNYIMKFKAGGGKTFDVGRYPLRIIFFSTVLLEMVLSLFVWYRFQSIKSASFVLNYIGGASTLTGLLSSALRANVQVDIFSASGAAMASLVAFIACLRALADKHRDLISERAVFFLFTLSGAMGMYFAGGLMNMFLSLTLSQIGASGLLQPVISERSEFGRTIAYFISRVVLLALFLAGCVILATQYDVFSIHVMAAALRGESAERTAFALMAAPLLYIFIKPPHYTTDSANRCYFSIRAHAAFFAFFRIVFVLYGAMAGLERIPALIGVIGLAAVFASILFIAGERDPVKFASATETSLKGFMLIAFAISLSSIYSVASVASYGYDATEAVIYQWLLFLPVAAALSVASGHLRQERNGVKLWLAGGMATRLPLTGLLFVLAICMLSGLPPLAGYAGRQLLYRSANQVNPFLSLALFMSSLFILLNGLRYIYLIMFGKRHDDACARFAGDQHITMPLLVLVCVVSVGTVFPGLFHDRVIQPCVHSLLSGVRHVGNAQYWNDPDEAGEEELEGDENVQLEADGGSI